MKTKVLLIVLISIIVVNIVLLIGFIRLWKNVQSNNKIYEVESYMTKVDLRQSLRDFVATWNTGDYSSVEEMNVLFPELKGYDIEVLKIYIDTWNSGKYSTTEEMEVKFPEFFPKEKKGLHQYNILGWKISIE